VKEMVLYCLGKGKDKMAYKIISVDDPKSKLSPGAIAGIVIGCLVFIAIIVLVVIYIKKKKIKGKNKGKNDNNDVEKQ